MTVDECRARCAGITNCAYWSRWNDGGCHLSASSTVHGASSVHSGPDAVQSAAGGITSGTQVFIKGFYIKLKLIFIFIFIYISVCSSVYIHQSILSLLSMQKWFGAELTLSYLTPGITSGTQGTNLHQHVCTSADGGADIDYFKVCRGAHNITFIHLYSRTYTYIYTQYTYIYTQLTPL